MTEKVNDAKPEQIATFADLFRGNSEAHYVRTATGTYQAVERGINHDDVARHFAGEPPSLLSIPIDHEARSHFGVIDFDRHDDAEKGIVAEPIDHVALARRVTELKLPLVVFKSKNGKGAWAVCFFKDSGVLASVAQALMSHYATKLDVPGDREIFPKQTELKNTNGEWQKGNGINLGYWGAERPAYGPHGEVLSLDQFIALAQERRFFGDILARDAKLEAQALGSAPARDDKPLTIPNISAIHAKNLNALCTASTGVRNDTLNKVCFFAARAFAAKALEGTEAEVKQAIRKAALAAGLTEDEIRVTGGSGWESGTRQPLPILDPRQKLIDIREWVNNRNLTPPPLDEAIADFTLCDPLAIDQLRKEIADRLGVSVPALRSAISRQRKEQVKPKGDSTFELRSATKEETRQGLAKLLLTTSEERESLGLPLSQEAADLKAEQLLWDYVKKHAQVFSTDSGQGYLLFHDKKEQPVPVTRDGHELSDFLTSLDVHSGARSRNRLGKHLGAMCWRDGARVEPRISFYYDPDNFTAYFAEGLGQLIRITSTSIMRIPNGSEGQLFLFPRNYQLWHLDLDALPPLTDFSPDLNALLPELLFSVLEFENTSLNPEDVQVLLNAYIATLFLPGIVAGKLLLQVLGDTGSAKTLFLRLLGRVIYGRQFEVTALDTDEKQVENALVNNSFVVFDDVKRTSNPAILGMIRRACTGGTCNRRELYSTFNQVTEPYRAAVAISCSDEPFTSSDEMSNRSLIIRCKQREDFVDEKDFLHRIDINRDRLMAEMMIRLQNVIIAVQAQKNFKPSVKMRMASFATFLLRVARHWDWGTSAKQVLDAWREEQEGAGLDASIMEALDAWITSPNWKPQRYSASELCKELARTSTRLGLSPWWIGKDAALIRALRHAFHAYQRHYGFCFEGRTSGHKPPSYWFDCSADQLREISQRIHHQVKNTFTEQKLSF